MGLKAYNVHFSEWQLAELERLANEGFYSSVAEAVRIAVRDLLARDLKARKRLNNLLGDLPAIDEDSPLRSLTSQLPTEEI